MNVPVPHVFVTLCTIKKKKSDPQKNPKNYKSVAQRHNFHFLAILIYEFFKQHVIAPNTQLHINQQ